MPYSISSTLQEIILENRDDLTPKSEKMAQKAPIPFDNPKFLGLPENISN